MFANFDVTARFLFTVLLACNKLQPSKTQGCPVSPCEYGGTCENNVCSCPPGLTGPTCSNVDCSNYPCYNGGTCVPGPQDMCNCPPGYVQPFCTTSCNDTFYSCMNGTCVGDVCNCDANFAGPRCKSAIAAYLNPSAITVTEGHVGQKEVTVQVCRQPSSEEVTLAVHTHAFPSDFALPDFDFVDIPMNPRQDVTISAGQPCTPVNVSIMSDLTQERMNETFSLDLYDPLPSSSSSSMVHMVPGQSYTFITITDDDPGCLIEPCQNGGTCNDDDLCSCDQGYFGLSCQSTSKVYLRRLELSVTEGNDGDDKSVQIDVCSLPSNMAMTVTVTTYQDSATSSDFAHINTSVTIPSGLICETVDISIVSDMTFELTEVFHVVILPIPSVYIPFGEETATVTIIDNDATEIEIEIMDIIEIINNESTTTEEVVIASERIAEISDDEDVLEEDPQRIDLVISFLESVVVRAGEATINVTDSVVTIVNNLMDLDRDILEDGMIEGGRAVAALEGQIENVRTKSDGNFSTVLDNVGVTAVKIDARSVGSSLAYANILPENETLSIDGALQEGNTRLFADADAIPLERTVTSISVPTTVLDLLGEAGVELTAVPVTFIVYGNDVLFRPSMPTEELEENNEKENKSTVTERVASQIISAIIRTGNTNIVNLTQGSTVITTFLSNLTISGEETIEARDCVGWSYNENSGEGFWTKDGCETTFKDNGNLTMCSCDRLGSFAILIRVRKGPVEAQITLYYITLIGSIISGLALIGCLITFVSLKSKQPTHIHINLCLSLLGFYIAFLLSLLAVRKEIQCTVASVFIHFFSLATLAWMSTEAMNMYYLFLKAERSTIRHFIPIACLLAYGLPAACALLVVVLDNSTDFQSASYCFIHPGYALYFGFLMEVVAMFVFNFIIFIWVIRKILCRPLMVSKTAENAKRGEIIKRVRHAILFWFVLGLSWIFGFAAAVDTKTLIFDYLYCFFISIQGILMFLLLCVANPAFQGIFRRRDSTQTKVTRQSTSRKLSSSQLISSSKYDIPMDSIDNPSAYATE